MTRAPIPNFNKLTDEQEIVVDKILSGPRGKVAKSGPFAVWLNNPGLALNAQILGQYCRDENSLSTRLTEFAIIIIARIWDADYQWQSHVGHAQKAGLAQSIIDALAKDEEPVFEIQEEAIVYRVARDLNLNRKISDDLYQKAVEVLGNDRLIDLIGVLGFYTLTAMTINTFEITPKNS